MIFQVTMKDADVLYDAINEALDEDLKDMDEDEAELLRDLRHEKLSEVASKWFKYSEYLTVEIDSDKATIRVIPVGEDEKDITD